MTNMDSNTWYRMYTNENEKDAWGGTILFSNHTFGAVFSQTYNASDVKPEQKWQFYTVDADYYVLRSSASGSDSFMSTRYDVNVTTDTHTSVRMTRNNASDDSVYWKVEPWGNGWWFFSNKLNGTKYHFGRGGSTGTTALLDSNITFPQVQQQFQFESISAINDKRFSTVSLPSTTVTSASNSTQTSGTSTASSSPSSSSSSSSSSPPASASSSSSGLSVGAKAGIGVGAGILAILAVVLALFFVRRRKQKPAYAEAPADEHSQAMSKEQWAYEMPGQVKAAEMGGVPRVEAPSESAPAELPGSTVQRG